MNIEHDYNSDHIIFLSSDESEEETSLPNSKDTLNATTGISISNTNKPIKNIIHHNSNNSSSEPNDKFENGWDENANNTINNWHNLFKQQSFIYQWILEHNKKISNKLMLASIIASSSLGIFSSFKFILMCVS
jgi:hypothetical protein